MQTPADTEKPLQTRALHIALLATLALFTLTSIALLFPMDVIERQFAAGKIPPLPKVVMDALQYRHFWHVLPAAVLGLLLLAWRWPKAGSRWPAWALLAFLWGLAYLFSYFVEFYVNLYSMSIYGREVRVHLLFAACFTVLAIGAATTLLATRKTNRPV